MKDKRKKKEGKRIKEGRGKINERYSKRKTAGEKE
jgi:hypothetical protein